MSLGRMEMQEQTSQSPWDGVDTEGCNGRTATGHCIVLCIRREHGNTGTVLAEGGMGSDRRHTTEYTLIV